ncbi:hypothetical protein NQ317_010967, partial [Molorchus minor]
VVGFSTDIQEESDCTHVSDTESEEMLSENEQVTTPSDLGKENLDRGNIDSDSSFGDDLQDQNFDINNYGSNSSSDTETSESEKDFIQEARCYTPTRSTENSPTRPNIQFSEKLKEQKDDITMKKEVRDVLSYPLKSKERKCALEKFRNDSNFDLYLDGKIRPKKQLTEPTAEIEYYPCIYCKAIFSKHYLNRHVKKCIGNTEPNKHTKVNIVSSSQTKVACALDPTNIISKLAIREEVHILHPKNFDNVVSATRQLCGYDPSNKTYKTPSLAMHTGTTLKLISEELIHLILRGSKGFQSESKEIALEWQRNVKNFKKLVEARWNKEISSVANKDLNEKRWRKPLLVPLINDVKKFKEGALNYAKECEKQFLEQKDTEQTYKVLVQCTLALLILFNRRRIGDVQYLKVNDYSCERKTDFQDFEATLTESEKILTKQYKRVVNGGKGSRAVVILIPPLLQNFMDLLLLNRAKYISSENNYVFALPNSTIKWSQGDVAIRNLTTKINLENPQAISSNRLRKHIATAMQILTMSKNDCKQFSKFMGHTEKTHEEFYELPVDVFQTARVVKLLIMMEKGIPVEFKGKSLSEIELKPDEYVEDNGNEEQIQARENDKRSNEETESDDNLPLSKIARKLSNPNKANGRKTQNMKKGRVSI